MEIDGAEAEEVAGVLLTVIVKILVCVGGHFDELRDGPLLGERKLLRILHLAIIQKTLVEIDTVHKVQGVGGDIAGNEVERLADGAGIDQRAGPPVLLEVEVVVLNGVDIKEETAGGEHSGGTAVCGYDVVVRTGVCLSLDKLGEVGSFTDVAVVAVPVKRDIESFFRDLVARLDGGNDTV